MRGVCAWRLFLYSVEVDATYLLCSFTGCCSCCDTHSVRLDLCICLVFSIGKLQQQSWSPTSSPGCFLSSTFTSEKAHLFSMPASILLHFRPQKVLRTHLTFSFSSPLFPLLSCNFSVCQIHNQKHTFSSLLLLTAYFFVGKDFLQGKTSLMQLI